MPTKQETLEGLGFSKNEAKVYLALLDIGSSTATKVAEKSNVHRTNVYDALERLISKGLVAYILKEDTKFFEVTDVTNLHNVLKEKELHLKNILPQLLLSQNLAKDKSEAHIFQGVKAVRHILNHFLDLKKKRFVYGVSRIASRMIGEGFLEDYHKRRIKLKLEMKQIYNSDAKDRINFLNKFSLTEARYLPKEFDSPVATSICENEVVLILFSDKPLVIQIKNNSIAEAYKRYFNLLWGLAKKEV